MICGTVIMFVGVPVLASIWRKGDFAVAFFIGCISLIMVNLLFASEKMLTDNSELKTDKNLNNPD